MNLRTNRALALRALAIGCVLAHLPASLRAQSTFGSIIGTVQDASGSAMPGVAVKVKNLNDNTTRSTLTDDAGEYQVLNLRPGSYQVVGSRDSFADATIASVSLDARQQIRIDLKLEL